MKKFKYKINGKEYEASVNKFEDFEAKITINGVTYNVELEKPEVEESAPKIQRPVATSSAPSAKSSGSGAGAVKSPLPGIIIDVKVNVGDEVKKGDVVVMLEAMKMENSINASVSGKVTSVNVKTGDSVLEGVTLLTIE